MQCRCSTQFDGDNKRCPNCGLKRRAGANREADSLLPPLRWAPRNVLAVSIIFFVIWLLYGTGIYAIPATTLQRIQHGMTRQEVIEVAGEPYSEHNGDMYYRVWNGYVTYSDSLVVAFDREGRVNWVSF